MLTEGKFGKEEKASKKLMQIASAASDKCEYHHGDLMPTLGRMGLDYAGSNNLPFINHEAMLGSRPYLGKDCGAGRYVKCNLNWWIPFLIKKELYDLVPLKMGENDKIEPYWIPFLIPYGLMNGSKGIATGWSNDITKYHPVDIAEWIYYYISDANVFPIIPWYIEFTGRVIIEGKGKSAKKVQMGENTSDIDNYKGIICKTEGIFKIINVYKKTTIVEVDDPNNPLKKKKEQQTLDFCDFEITEVPIGVEWNKLYADLSNKCEYSADRSKDNKTPHLFFQGYKGIPEPADISMISKIPMNNITGVDDNGIPIEFDNIYQLLVAYIENMKPLYEQLKKKKLEVLEEKLKINEKKLFIITKVKNKEWRFVNRKRDEITRELKEWDITYEIFKSIDSSMYGFEGINEITDKVNKLKQDYEYTSARGYLEDWKEDLIVFIKEIAGRKEYAKYSHHEFPRISTPVDDLIYGRVYSPFVQNYQNSEIRVF